MFFEKLTAITLSLVPAGIIGIGVGTILGQESSPVETPVDAPAAAKSNAADPSKAERSNPEHELMLYRRVLASARARYQDQQPFYEEGRITVDRFLDASTQLGEAEKAIAKSPRDRISAQRRSLRRAEEILSREKDEMKQGKGTIADVSEAELRRSQIELELFRMEREADIHRGTDSAPAGSIEGLLPAGTRPIKAETQPSQGPIPKRHTEYLEAATKYFQSEEWAYTKGVGPHETAPYVSACEIVAKAEQTVARTAQERRVSQERLIKRLQGVESSIRANIDAGIATPSELESITMRRLVAEIELESGSSEAGHGHLELLALKKRVGDLEARLNEVILERNSATNP